jgi:hypothetical protein
MPDHDVVEHITTIERAERDEISVGTQIVEAFNARRAGHRDPMLRNP